MKGGYRYQLSEQSAASQEMQGVSQVDTRGPASAFPLTLRDFHRLIQRRRKAQKVFSLVLSVLRVYSRHHFPVHPIALQLQPPGLALTITGRLHLCFCNPCKPGGNSRGLASSGQSFVWAGQHSRLLLGSPHCGPLPPVTLPLGAVAVLMQTSPQSVPPRAIP